MLRSNHKGIVPMDKKEVTLENGLILEGEVGEGTYGTVWRARWPERYGKRCRLALKVPKDVRDSSFFRETAALRALHGATGVTQLLEVLPYREGKPWGILTDLYEGDLEWARGSIHWPLSPRSALVVLTDVARALCSAHSRGIVHRDVTERNIFVETEGGEVTRAVLGDWGTAAAADRCDSGTIGGSDYVTAIWYRAPENILGCIDYGEKVDVWALGMSLALMLGGYGEFPFTRQRVEKREEMLKCLWRMFPASETSWGWAREKKTEAIRWPTGAAPSTRSIKEQVLMALRLNHPDHYRRYKGDKTLELLLDVATHALTINPERRPSIESLLGMLRSDRGGRVFTAEGASVRVAAPPPHATPYPVAYSHEAWLRVVETAKRCAQKIWSTLRGSDYRRVHRRRLVISSLELVSRLGVRGEDGIQNIVTLLALGNFSYVESAPPVGWIRSALAAYGDGVHSLEIGSRLGYLARYGRTAERMQRKERRKFQARAESYLLLCVSNVSLLRRCPKIVAQICSDAAYDSAPKMRLVEGILGSVRAKLETEKAKTVRAVLGEVRDQFARYASEPRDGAAHLKADVPDL